MRQDGSVGIELVLEIDRLEPNPAASSVAPTWRVAARSDPTLAPLGRAGGWMGLVVVERLDVGGLDNRRPKFDRNRSKRVFDLG